jgi:PAS domain S-box-containing protein
VVSSGETDAARLAVELSEVRVELQRALAQLADAQATLETAPVSRALADERQALAEAQRLAQLGSFTYDPADRTFTYSEQLLRTWGVSGDVDGVAIADEMIHTDDRALVRDHWRRVLTEGGQGQYEHRIVRADGEMRHLRTNIELSPGVDGRPPLLHGTQIDVTELVVAEQKAKRANAFFDAVLTAMPDPTFVMELATGRVIYRSPGPDLLGLTAEQYESLGPEEVAARTHPDDRARRAAARVAAADLADGEVQQLRHRGLHADGTWRWLNSSVTPFRRDEGANVVEVLGVVRDMTEAVLAENLLAHGALHDDLTGLPNRALLIDRLDTAVARSGREGLEVAVLFCDLDSFKRVNDSGGHAAGDAVLREIAKRLTNSVREGDTVARVGGDEFVIVVEPLNRTIRGEPSGPDRVGHLPDRFLAVRVAESIVEAVREPVTFEGLTYIVTASVGITYGKVGAEGGAERASAEQLLQDADSAMYRAKSRGKDRFALFEHQLRTNLVDRGRIEQVLRQALDHPTGRPRPGFVPLPRSSGSSLTAVYQPIFDSGNGALVGFEALARLVDANGLGVPPDVFIAVAEETRLIHPLGAVMLELACAQLHAWRQQVAGLEHVSMAVNVSGLQAQDAAIGNDVRRVLAAHHLVAADLVLELTETALLQAAPSTILILRALHTDGVGISIDDFGTGYASLRYLATLPVSSIKIDRTFTSGLPHDETSRKIVKAVAGLAADLDLGCVVEGVETAEQRAALPDGVQLQGYLTGRPAAPAALDLPALVAHGAPTP